MTWRRFWKKWGDSHPSTSMQEDSSENPSKAKVTGEEITEQVDKLAVEKHKA